MSAIITDKNEWLTTISNNYSDDVSIALDNLELVDGFIIDPNNCEQRVETFQMPDVEHISNFFRDVKGRGFKVFVHRLQPTKVPDMSQLPEDIKSKFFTPSPDVDRTKLDPNELQNAISNLPLLDQFILHAFVKES